MKKSLGKSKPISAAGYGERIRRAVWLRQSETGGRVTLALAGEAVAKLLGRKEPFTAGTVSGWIEERSEPPLAVFLALARWTGVQVGYLAFGETERGVGESLAPATEPPAGYYSDVTQPAKKVAETRKRRGA